ncbi:MAG: hypothetical protein KGQ87_03990 [Verrucomicrobia bacterium]|nr:hypothetical protein [Verrucomicrobiota bacterium]
MKRHATHYRCRYTGVKRIPHEKAPQPLLVQQADTLMIGAMTRQGTIFRALGALVLVWLVIWGVRAYANSRKVTAEKINLRIEQARFADWSENAAGNNAKESARREKEIREIADLVNRLDFQERQKNRRQRGGEEFFRKLNTREKSLFIDLTIMESMNRFMESLDAMPADQRKKFVEQGLKEISDGKTSSDIARTGEMSGELLDKITREGMRAYFEKSSMETKLDLAPLMQAINETMQGMRGNQFGPGQR